MHVDRLWHGIDKQASLWPLEVWSVQINVNINYLTLMLTSKHTEKHQMKAYHRKYSQQSSLYRHNGKCRQFSSDMFLRWDRGRRYTDGHEQVHEQLAAYLQTNQMCVYLMFSGTSLWITSAAWPHRCYDHPCEVWN